MGRQPIKAYRIELDGVVQGVGFRPFVYRLSHELGLKGFVRNSPSGLRIFAEGRNEDLLNYVLRLKSDAPPQAQIQKFEYTVVQPQGYTNFAIIGSEIGAQPRTLAMPDLATCEECRQDIFDPHNRRYLYPFTNCTDCGPRYSIMESLPYDRQRTSMKRFMMCSDCALEFSDPNNRRFHAQPNACPTCGPSLELWSKHGFVLEKNNQALIAAVDILRRGKILALKSLGGFQLLVDASNENAVRELRQRKHREEKPFALMLGSMAAVRKYCAVSGLEEKLLLSPQAPIVLLSKLALERKEEVLASSVGHRPDGLGTPSDIASSVAPGSPYLGIMLGYTPLHHLLLNSLEFPVVATSGNVSDEPICIDEKEAVLRLGNIADFFLVHNRPIIRPMDDSVVRVVHGQISTLRRARGYAPLPVRVDEKESSLLALGAHDKNAIALKVNGNVFLSQHIGDLQTAESIRVFHAAVKDLKDFYAPTKLNYVCDHHPDYFSSRFAKTMTDDVLSVQHHHSHIVSTMAEHGLEGEVLGLAWDGTGLGDDGTIWGGEFLLCTRSDFQRRGHLRQFRLPGGDAVSREPRKSALGIIFELSSGHQEEFRDLPCFQEFSSGELKVLWQMLAQGTNSPWTSSMGRLFDAVSSIAGICQRSSFEGQAAMLLEYAIAGESGADHYWCDLREIKAGQGVEYLFDWAQMLRDFIGDVRLKVPPSRISLKFHNTIVELGVAVARRIQQRNIVLGGGCFQNKYLLEHLVDRLQEDGFHVYFPQQVPVNDGGIALGQAMIAASRLQQETLHALRFRA